MVVVAFGFLQGAPTFAAALAEFGKSDKEIISDRKNEPNHNFFIFCYPPGITLIVCAQVGVD